MCKCNFIILVFETIIKFSFSYSWQCDKQNISLGRWKEDIFSIWQGEIWSAVINSGCVFYLEEFFKKVNLIVNIICSYMWVSMPCNSKRKIRETTEGKFTCLYTFGNYLLFVHKLTCLYTFGAWGSLINWNTISVYIYIYIYV